jgi:hypothetical protein
MVDELFADPQPENRPRVERNSISRHTGLSKDGETRDLISIVVPACNEAAVIGELNRRLPTVR